MILRTIPTILLDSNHSYPLVRCQFIFLQKNLKIVHRQAGTALPVASVPHTAKMRLQACQKGIRPAPLLSGHMLVFFREYGTVSRQKSGSNLVSSVENRVEHPLCRLSKAKKSLAWQKANVLLCSHKDAGFKPVRCHLLGSELL